jgi:hypothetical protein
MKKVPTVKCWDGSLNIFSLPEHITLNHTKYKTYYTDDGKASWTNSYKYHAAALNSISKEARNPAEKPLSCIIKENKTILVTQEMQVLTTHKYTIEKTGLPYLPFIYVLFS